MPNFVAMKQSQGKWQVVLDSESGGVRRSSSADDLLNELSQSLPLSKILIAEELTVTSDESISGGSAGDSAQVIADVKTEYPYSG